MHYTYLFNQSLKFVFTISIFTLISFSCVKKYDFAPEINFSSDSLIFKGANQYQDLSVEGALNGDIYIQFIEKDLSSGYTEVLYDNYDTPITVENITEYNDYSFYDYDMADYKINSYILRGNSGSTISYSSSNNSGTYGLRISVETLSDVVTKDFFFGSSPGNSFFFYSISGTIYQHDLKTNKTTTLVNTGFSRLEKISYSSYNNRIYFSSFSEFSRDLNYYDLSSKSLYVDFSSSFYGINNVKAIDNSSKYIYSSTNGNTYIRSNGTDDEIETRGFYRNEYITDAAATNTGNSDILVYAEQSGSSEYLRYKVGFNSYQNIEDGDFYDYENLTITNDGNFIGYTKDNDLIITGKSNNFNIKTLIAFGVTDADFSTSSDDIIYIKGGNVYRNTTSGNNETLILNDNSNINNITW